MTAKKSTTETTPPPKPSRPVRTVRGTNTTANPDNCTGSGKPWATGGKCPECGAQADSLANGRRGSDLAPRVPKHVPAAIDARQAADAAVLNGTRTSDKAPGQPPARPARRTAKNDSTPAEAVPSSPGKSRAANKDSAVTVVVPKPKAERKTKDPLKAEFTTTITSYLEWFRATLASGGVDFNKIPRDRLAGLAITMYGRYQVSPERRAARNGSGS
jgi:hypothetical protein